MEFQQIIEQRASVRSFEAVDIAPDVLQRILDAGRRAPSGNNRQPWEFIVVLNANQLKKLGQIQGCIAQCSAAIAVVVDDRESQYWKEDAAAAIENMLLCAVAEGLGSLWVEGYVLLAEAYAREVLGVPAELRVLAILPLGRPASPPRQAAKKPLSKITHRDSYGQPYFTD